MISIDSKKCIKCKACVQECPASAIELDNFEVNNNCIKCGHCIAVCPTLAVTFDNRKVNKLIKNKIKSKELLNLYINNRSIRNFTTKKIPDKNLHELLSAIKYFPSASNQRKLEIKVLTKKSKITELNDIVAQEILKKLKKAANPVVRLFIAIFVSKNLSRLIKKYYMNFKNASDSNSQNICHNAPVVIIFHAKKSKLSMAKADSYIWSSNITNLAATMGISACIIGYAEMGLNGSSANTKALFDIPRNHEVHAALLLGYAKNQYRNEIDRFDHELKIKFI